MKHFVLLCRALFGVGKNLQKQSDPREREKMIEIFRGGSARTWRHINLQGICEFILESESKIFAQKISQILDLKFAA